MHNCALSSTYYYSNSNNMQNCIDRVVILQCYLAERREYRMTGIKKKGKNVRAEIRKNASSISEKQKEMPAT